MERAHLWIAPSQWPDAWRPTREPLGGRSLWFYDSRRMTGNGFLRFFIMLFYQFPRVLHCFLNLHKVISLLLDGKWSQKRLASGRSVVSRDTTDFEHIQIGHGKENVKELYLEQTDICFLFNYFNCLVSPTHSSSKCCWHPFDLLLILDVFVFFAPRTALKVSDEPWVNRLAAEGEHSGRDSAHVTHHGEGCFAS